MHKSVIKRDGSIEPYQEEKIARVVSAAGAEDHVSNEVAKRITAWLESNTSPEVPSLAIRDQVIVELLKVDTDAASMFSWYQKTKEQK